MFTTLYFTSVTDFILSAGFNILCIAFASNSIMMAWLYGALFDKPRKYFEDRSDTFLGKLLTCPMCLSYHVAFWVTVLIWLPAELLLFPYSYIPVTILYSLSAVTIIHYLQGVLPIVDAEEDETEESDEPKNE